MSADLLPIPVARHQSGYVPRHDLATEDAYIWRAGPRSWLLRVNTEYTDHPTLKAARIACTQALGLDLRTAEDIDGPPEHRVVLRKFPDSDGGDVIALFPDIDEGRGMIGSYQTIGQHGPASPAVVSRTQPIDPTDPDAAALLAELRRIGYRPRIIRRMPARR